MSGIAPQDGVRDRATLVGVHLNGSVNLPDADAVMRTVIEAVGPWLKRVPDGETGPRRGWILAMLPKFQAVEQLVEAERSSEELAADPGLPPLFHIREGADPEQIAFGDLGYATAALDSHRVFAELRDQGVVPPHIRFQVSLPTPLAVSRYAIHEDAPAVRSAFTVRLREEIDAITEQIPHHELAMQWDVAYEFGLIEEVFIAGGVEVDRSEAIDACVDHLVELASLIPSDVSLGYHLCYGDRPTSGGEGKHFIEPRDTGNLVAVANAVSARLERPVDWFSMPVPIERDDDDFFRPLSGLELHPETDLYLGLVHHQDGADGARRRVAAAQRFVPEFGIATECGMGRKTPEQVASILEAKRTVLDERDAS